MFVTKEVYNINIILVTYVTSLFPALKYSFFGFLPVGIGWLINSDKQMKQINIQLFLHQ